MSALPKWPSEDGRCDFGYYEEWKYEEARADAALARLRVAVAELEKHTRHYECEDCWYSCAVSTCNERRKSDVCDCGAQRIADLLAAIGPLPDEKP